MKTIFEDKKPHDTQDSQFHCEENSTVLKQNRFRQFSTRSLAASKTTMKRFKVFKQ